MNWHRKWDKRKASRERGEGRWASKGNVHPSQGKLTPAKASIPTEWGIWHPWGEKCRNGHPWIVCKVRKRWNILRVWSGKISWILHFHLTILHTISTPLIVTVMMRIKLIWDGNTGAILTFGRGYKNSPPSCPAHPPVTVTTLDTESNHKHMTWWMQK